jgi:hypothetical protein
MPASQFARFQRVRASVTVVCPRGRAMNTVRVWSELCIALEVGLVHGVKEFKSTLQPGPNYRHVQLRRGLNEVDGSLVREWLRKNKFLACVKEHKIRIVEKISTSQMESAA